LVTVMTQHHCPPLFSSALSIPLTIQTARRIHCHVHFGAMGPGL